MLDDFANTELREGVLLVTLNRPKKMNALTMDMCSSLTEIFREAAHDDAVRCVLLRAEGKAFCAGRDISDATPGEDAAELLKTVVNPLILALYTCPKPTVSAVNGAAMGIGLGLALSCDIVVGSEYAKFSSPFSKLGGALDSGGHFFLSRRIGPGQALSMIYTAETVDAEKAVRVGLLDRLVISEVLDEAALRLADQISAGPLMSLIEQKALLRSALSIELDAVLNAEADLQGVLSRTADYAEGLSAFKEKRAPNFRQPAKG